MASLVCRVCPSTSILSFLSRMAVRTDEFQASREDGFCVVVEGRDVVAVRALDDLQPGGRQRLAQDRQAGWTDDVVVCAVIGERRRRDLVQVSLGDLPQGR